MGHNQTTATYGLVSCSLSKQRPQQRDSLQGLAQTHVISENTPTALEVPEAHHAAKHELHALPLVLAQVLAQRAVDTDAPATLAIAVSILFLPKHLAMRCHNTAVH